MHFKPKGLLYLLSCYSWLKQKSLLTWAEPPRLDQITRSLPAQFDQNNSECTFSRWQLPLSKTIFHFVSIKQFHPYPFPPLSCILLLLKTKSPKIASWPGILTSDKETRTKVVLARKLGKQGLGSTPDVGWEWGLLLLAKVTLGTLQPSLGKHFLVPCGAPVLALLSHFWVKIRAPCDQTFIVGLDLTCSLFRGLNSDDFIFFRTLSSPSGCRLAYLKFA